MRLTELQPRWVHPNMFVFLCPHCRAVLLSCKNAEMSDKYQRHLFEEIFGEDWNERVIGCNPSFCWSIQGPGLIVNNYQSGIDMNRVSVTPSIDASPSGHWHGHITNGEIVN